jgi:hypothetical protein
LNSNPRWQYRWALDLFDYLTVQGPNEDFFPRAVRNGTSAAQPFAGWATQPAPVSNSGANPPNRLNEEAEAIEGLININTAPAKVLAMVPWVPVLNGDTDNFQFDLATGSVTYVAAGDGQDDNEQIARAIVRWRDGELSSGTLAQGPFTSIFDLYRVDAFRNLNAAMVAAVATDVDDDLGDISPLGIGGTAYDYVRHDYEEQYLLLNRVASLITTRSDTFTVYVVVQGWRITDPRRPAAGPEVQRRAAFIVDRTPIHRKGNTGQLITEPKVIPVASD